jgi:hypothetical protein
MDPSLGTLIPDPDRATNGNLDEAENDLVGKLELLTISSVSWPMKKRNT